MRRSSWAKSGTLSRRTMSLPKSPASTGSTAPESTSYRTAATGDPDHPGGRPGWPGHRRAGGPRRRPIERPDRSVRGPCRQIRAPRPSEDESDRPGRSHGTRDELALVSSARAIRSGEKAAHAPAGCAPDDHGLARDAAEATRRAFAGSGGSRRQERGAAPRSSALLEFSTDAWVKGRLDATAVPSSISPEPPIDPETVDIDGAPAGPARAHSLAPA